jgi:hypothetical protein
MRSLRGVSQRKEGRRVDGSALGRRGWPEIHFVSLLCPFLLKGKDCIFCGEVFELQSAGYSLKFDFGREVNINAVLFDLRCICTLGFG